MPAPLIPAIPAAMGLGKGALLAGLGSIAATPMVSQLLSEIGAMLPTRDTKRAQGASGGQSNPGSRRARSRARLAERQGGGEAEAAPAVAVDDMESPATIAPTPYEQITGAVAPTRQRSTPSRSSSRASTQKQPEVVVVPAPQVQAPVAAPVSPNAMPVQRSAGMSPDTSYEEAAAIASAVQAEQDAAAQAALDSRYNQLLAMYGIAPGSGAPKVNQAAAQEYYQDPSVYEALSRVYSGAPTFSAWG